MKRIECPVDPMFADLVPRYLSDRRDDIVGIRDLVRAGAFDEIERHGHQMAGSGKAFGFSMISWIGIRLQEAARRRDLAAVAEALRGLEQFLDAVVLVYPTNGSDGTSAHD